MTSSQCTRQDSSVSSLIFVIMIVAKFILLFSPLLLLAHAQSGGRLGFFSRPDFRRPRPWERPTVSPVTDTPLPTVRVTEHITDSPKFSTELPTITPVKFTPAAPVSSLSRSSPRERVWVRPVFQGSRPIADGHSPAVSIVTSTTKPGVYIITPSSIKVPFVENHDQIEDPNNFNSKGRYIPKITHNNDEIPSDSIKMKLPLTTKKITELITEKTIIPTENHSPMVSSTSTTTTESVTYSMAPTTTTTTTTAIPFINNPTAELRTKSKPLTTPRETFIPTRTSNYDLRTGRPVYMSHNNVPTPGYQPQYTPGDYLKPSSRTIPEITKLPSSTTESSGYTIPTSPKIPFFDPHQRYNDVYPTTKTPISFKIVSTTEEPSTTTRRTIYQENWKVKNKIASDSEIDLGTITKALIKPKTEPEEYTIKAKTKGPIIDVHKNYDNGFTSHRSVGYANGYEKSSEEQSKSDGYNAPIYPVYHHQTEKVNHYEQSSLSTRNPEGYTIATSKAPFIDSHKLYDAGFTSGPTVEYTNGHEERIIIPTNKIPTYDSQDFIKNIYLNHNHRGDDYEHSLTPKLVTTTQATYQYRPPKTTTKKAVVTQTVRPTNSYRYSDTTPKPTTRYTTTTTTTTTTVRPSRLKNVYDIENFKCTNQDAYYSITNQCDDFIECKSGHPIQTTCPDGLHFNRAAKYGEYPCAFPSQVQCDSNSVIRQPEPTSSCPRHFGYFSMKDGRCDKYLMCQGGIATIMSCPAGLAFNDATSSCDWPSNVPGCLPEAFEGFTCPTPEFNEDGEPSIFKYRYDNRCKQYIACQEGHPRLLSCDAGLSFDESSESCVDDIKVTNCT